MSGESGLLGYATARAGGGYFEDWAESWLGQDGHDGLLRTSLSEGLAIIVITLPKGRLRKVLNRVVDPG
jgi:hypothetical protein